MPRPPVKRINLDDPTQLAALLRSGAIWQFPQYWQMASDAIKRGLVPLAECQNVPPQVAAGFREDK